MALTAKWIYSAALHEAGFECEMRVGRRDRYARNAAKTLMYLIIIITTDTSNVPPLFFHHSLCLFSLFFSLSIFYWINKVFIEGILYNTLHFHGRGGLGGYTGF